MNNYLEKYRLHIGLGLIVMVIVASGILLWQRKDLVDSWQKEKTALEVEINNLQKENEDLQNKIGQLEKSIQLTNENQIKSGQELGKVKSASSVSNESAPLISSKVNINSADARQLESLPGIGPTRAQQIIEYRQSQEGFKTIEEIKNIRGIGEKTFEKMKDMIIVE